MKLTVNGADVEVDDRQARSPLLWVLGDVPGLGGTKLPWGESQSALHAQVVTVHTGLTRSRTADGGSRFGIGVGGCEPL